jgi:hypothetical protein
VTPIDPITVATQVAAILEQLRIRYVIGGSVASSILGEPRSTLDLDIMIEATAEQVQRLAAGLAGEFYIDEEDAITSFRQGSSFNAVHLPSSMKVDFFPADELGHTQIERRQAIVARPNLSPLYFYSAEDLVVRKLLWYRSGGESSSRQWRDVVSILKTAPVDVSLVLRRAREQNVDDLLSRAADEADLSL